MSALSRLRPGFQRTATDDIGGTSTEVNNMSDSQKQASAATNDASSGDDKSHEPTPYLPDEDAQRGVKMAEGIALTWSKKSLIWVFIKSVLYQP